MKLLKQIMLFPLVVVAATAFASGTSDHSHSATKKPGASASATGKPGDAAKVSRTIAVNMSDSMRYEPAQITVKRGETIKFVARNSGKLKHEMILGPIKELKAHAELMKKFPDMEHDEPNQLVVDPGKTGELVWLFTKAGIVEFACLQPGHFEAGMRGKVAVK